MSIKIAHISISDALGGAAIAAGRLNQLMNEDVELSSKMVVLVKNTENGSTFSLGNYALQKARTGNLINNLIGSFKKSYGLFSFSLIGNELIGNYIIQEADVIYIHWVNNGMMSWKSIQQLFSLRKPIFLFGHDMWYFTGGCHQSNGCLQFKSGCKKCPYFENKILQNLASNNFTNKNKAYGKYLNVNQILPSSNFHQKALSSNIIESSRLHFIPNVIDTDKFISKTEIYTDSRIKIVYGAMGGRLNPYKGWDDFVYFATKISENFNQSIEIGLFGYDFKNDEIRDLPFVAKSYGVINDENEMIKMYQNSDVFIFPSNQESFGQTLFEAMSCGVIPITYNVGIASDLIENNINGFIIENGNKEGLVDAFQKLMTTDIPLIKTNARKTILTNFSKEVLIKKHLKLIQSVL